MIKWILVLSVFLIGCQRSYVDRCDIETLQAQTNIAELEKITPTRYITNRQYALLDLDAHDWDDDYERVVMRRKERAIREQLRVINTCGRGIYYAYDYDYYNFPCERVRKLRPRWCKYRSYSKRRYRNKRKRRRK